MRFRESSAIKIYFGMRSTRDIIMRHGVLTAGATWATDRLGFQASRSHIPIGFYADGRVAYISSIFVLATMPTGRQGFQCLKWKGNMCNFRTGVSFFECGVLFVILSTSVIVKQIRLLVKGAQVLSVSLTSLPYPGVGDPKWGLLRACVLGLKYY